MAEQTMSLRLLETLTSALYEDPIILFREYVQNSIDARNIDKSNKYDDFSVDITIDRVSHNIQIFDNGYGIPKEQFLSKMESIGKSEKDHHEGQIGFRGIGRLAAMPLCDELVFENKREGTDECLTFTWNGKRFNELLNQKDETIPDAALNSLKDSSTIKHDGDVTDHYFKVEIRGYQDAISASLESNDFEDKLCRLLPLRYSPEFTKQTLIKTKYQEFMGQSPDIYSCRVTYNEAELYKPYTDEDILASGIVIWELRFPGEKEDAPDERIGILWFSFDRVIKALDKDKPYGIFVRSKNMLMGDQYSLANAINRSMSEYITTPRELTQVLNGVNGEMLINYDALNDNARRDWFRIDKESIKLGHIIVEFMRRLHTYRYAASGYFRDKTKEKSENKLIEAYKGLITNYDPNKFLPDINKLKKEIEASKEVFAFADEDIPTYPITIRRFYERLVTGLYEDFSARNEKVDFIKIRTFIKKYLNQTRKS